MELHREDLECTSTAGNSAPLNWIATVPIDAGNFDKVLVQVNKENMIVFQTKNEIHEIFPEVNVIACLIFKNVPGRLCKNWHTVQKGSVRIPLFAPKIQQQVESDFFEEMLGIELALHHSADYKQIVEVISKFDRLLLEFQKNFDHITNVLCINASSPLLDDMTFTAKSKSMTIRGAITRQNVVDSIRFQEKVSYFDERLGREFDDAHLHKRSMVFLKAIFGVMEVRVYNLSWTSCYTWMHQEKLGGAFESNCHSILLLRVHLCQLMQTLQTSTSTTEDKEACAKLLKMALSCMDTSLVHNINVLCDIKDVLHDVCLPSISMKSSFFKNCSLTHTIRQLVHEAMKNRVAHNIDRRNTPFAQMKSPLTKFVLKQVLLDSMRLYLQSCDVQTTLCHINPNLNQSKNHQCQFEPGTMMIYSEDPCMCLLKAIFEVSILFFKLDSREINRLPNLYRLAEELKKTFARLENLLLLTSDMMKTSPEDLKQIVKRLIIAYVLRSNAEEAIQAALTWLQTQEE